MRIVLTFSGSDKPGIVHLLADIVTAHGGNWHDSRMARLGGRFVGMLDVSLPKASEAGLRNALDALDAQGIRVLVDTGDTTIATPTHPCTLECTATDRPGIVQSITEVLLAHRVNVLTLSTGCIEAPMAGGYLFRATAELDLPAGTNLGVLHRALEAIADDFLVELNAEAPE